MRFSPILRVQSVNPIKKHIMQNEMLNCLEEARSMCRSLNVDHAEGLFVVNVSAPYYCRSTDAFAGYYICQSESFNTREEATAFANSALDEDAELSCKILPALPVAPLPQSTYSFLNKKTGSIRTYGCNSHDYAYSRLCDEVGNTEDWVHIL